jgi:hypothetical protein
MAKLWGFTERATQRIGDAVRRVEGMAKPGLCGPDGHAPGQGVEFRRFELKTSLVSGGTATAHPLEWRADTQVYSAVLDESREFTIRDALNSFQGTGRDPGPPVVRGTRGYAIKLPDSPDWEVLQREC